MRVSNENTGGAIGWCLDAHDLAFSKLAARREKDLAFVANLLRFKMVRASRLTELIAGVGEIAVRERLAEALELCQRV